MRKLTWDTIGIALLWVLVIITMIIAQKVSAQTAPTYPPLVNRALVTFAKVANVAPSVVRVVSYRPQTFRFGAVDCPGGAGYGKVTGYAVTFLYHATQFDYMVDASGTVALCHVGWK